MLPPLALPPHPCPVLLSSSTTSFLSSSCPLSSNLTPSVFSLPLSLSPSVCMWVSPAISSHFEKLCYSLKSHPELQRSNSTSHGIEFSEIKTHCQTFLFVHWLSQGFVIAANNDVHTRMTLKYCHTYDCVG